ncbi:hypothetical protein RsS62_33460 [Rhizobium dioscoreae]|uniref:Uncharacterized protein n=1 Tax=Rhizobium dioscoreae TaxID=2653122 RepID=A0ABQ0YW50_9HYPH|nr:hypothetical protein RsS62_33460 [Rhizobium dioscoreae]GES47489.1 hypothetical protein RsS93_01030 [Rhizobium dioscoreae]GLU80046.1 hypothetical protein Rhsp01_12220 [Rhizobium sp. NBRC 114257]
MLTAPSPLPSVFNGSAAMTCVAKLKDASAVVHDFSRCFIGLSRFLSLDGVEPVAGFLFPEEKVTRFRRIRKFIYQKGDIGISDS